VPNFKIPTSVRDEIKNNAAGRATVTLNYARANFPLSFAEIPELILHPQLQRQMEDLTNQGVTAMLKQRTIKIMFRWSDQLAIRRGAVVQLYLPTAIYVPHDSQWSNTPQWDDNQTRFLKPRLDHLSNEKRVALAAWIERTVRAKRLHEITVWAVNEVVDKHIPTTGHLVALWPNLATLVDDPVFRQRLRNPPPRLKAYAPSTAVFEKVHRQIHAADIVLNAGEMLNPYDWEGQDVIGSIPYWEPLQGDTIYATE
jgi:hypothetical protein